LRGFGCGRRAGTERFLCLCVGSRVEQVGGVGKWFGERVGRMGVRERGGRWCKNQGWRLAGGGGTVMVPGGGKVGGGRWEQSWFQEVEQACLRREVSKRTFM